jgi:hypothetical protein
MLKTSLVMIDLGTWGRELTLSDDHQQQRRAAASKCEHSACSAGDKLQLYDNSGRESAPLVIDKRRTA